MTDFTPTCSTDNAYWTPENDAKYNNRGSETECGTFYLKAVAEDGYKKDNYKQWLNLKDGEQMACASCASLDGQCLPPGIDTRDVPCASLQCNNPNNTYYTQENITKYAKQSPDDSKCNTFYLKALAYDSPYFSQNPNALTWKSYADGELIDKNDSSKDGFCYPETISGNGKFPYYFPPCVFPKYDCQKSKCVQKDGGLYNSLDSCQKSCGKHGIFKIILYVSIAIIVIAFLVFLTIKLMPKL